MMKSFEDIQKLGKDSVEKYVASVTAATKGAQAIALESSDYAKKSFEDGTAVVETLMGSKDLSKAIEVQTDFAKTSYEGAVAQATKIGEMMQATAKEAFAPYEDMFPVK